VGGVNTMKKFIITDKKLEKLVREREIQECWHEWEIIEKQFDSFDNLLGIIIFCNKCGKIEKKNI
jgi:hypothetical protein